MCMVCQKVKVEHQVSSRLLQRIKIPRWKWDRITMDFVVRLPLIERKHDSAWVVVDRLIKSAHFLPLRTDYSLDKPAELYIREIVRLHGIPVATPEPSPTRLVDPNRNPGDAQPKPSIKFIYNQKFISQCYFHFNLQSCFPIPVCQQFKVNSVIPLTNLTYVFSIQDIGITGTVPLGCRPV